MIHLQSEPDALSVGDYLRRKREALAEGDRTFSLRQMAARCDITPAYLSRIERGELAPPGEDTLRKLAQELGEDQDVLLAMAGKISADLRAIILSRPKLFADLIRSVKSMPDKAVIKIVREVRDGEW
jgi:transcriptional regulator with XRE-family HTH domain